MAFPERRTVDILLTTALLTAVGAAVYCARRGVTMKTDYVFLRGVMWTQFGLVDAGRELVRALHSDDPDIAVLASALLESTSPHSGRIQKSCKPRKGITSLIG